jgi:hypothetical protein
MTLPIKSGHTSGSAQIGLIAYNIYLFIVDKRGKNDFNQKGIHIKLKCPGL